MRSFRILFALFINAAGKQYLFSLDMAALSSGTFFHPGNAVISIFFFDASGQLDSPEITTLEFENQLK